MAGSLGRILVIGASHGGPNVLAAVLRGLPAQFGLPVLLVQHISKGGGEDFVQWLMKKVHLPVRQAANGELIRPGAILVAPAGRHLAVCKPGMVHITDDAAINHCRPSIDVLFSSAADVYGVGCLAVLLSGLGEDGARGAGNVRRCMGRTVVQDEASSAVFGMNRVAVEMGNADRVATPDEIVGEILAWAGCGTEEG